MSPELEVMSARLLATRIGMLLLRAEADGSKVIATEALRQALKQPTYVETEWSPRFRSGRSADHAVYTAEAAQAFVDADPNKYVLNFRYVTWWYPVLNGKAADAS